MAALMHRTRLCVYPRRRRRPPGKNR